MRFLSRQEFPTYTAQPATNMPYEVPRVCTRNTDAFSPRKSQSIRNLRQRAGWHQWGVPVQCTGVGKTNNPPLQIVIAMEIPQQNEANSTSQFWRGKGPRGAWFAFQVYRLNCQDGVPKISDRVFCTRTCSYVRASNSNPRSLSNCKAAEELKTADEPGIWPLARLPNTRPWMTGRTRTYIRWSSAARRGRPPARASGEPTPPFLFLQQADRPKTYIHTSSG